MLSFYYTIGPEVFDFTFERWYAFVELGAVMVNLVLLFFILRSGSQNPAARWFSLFVLCLSIWGFSNFLGRISETVDQNIFWAHMAPPGYVLMSVVFFTFTLIYTRREEIFNNFFVPFLLYVPALFFMFLAWNTEYIIIHDSSQYRPHWYGWDVDAGSLFWVFVVWLEVYFWGSLALLFSHLRKVEDVVRRKQTLFIIVGLFVPLVIGTTTDALFPILGKDFPETAVIFTTVMALFVGYAILKYKLFFVSPSTVLSSIIETMTEALIVLSPTGYIERINRAGLDLLDYQKEEILHEPVKNIIRPGKSWLAFEERVLLPLLQGKSVGNFETTFVTRHGKFISINFSASSLKSREGEISAIVAVASDVTQTKRLIRKLERTAKELNLSKYELERRLAQMTKT